MLPPKSQAVVSQDPNSNVFPPIDKKAWQVTREDRNNCPHLVHKSAIVYCKKKMDALHLFKILTKFYSAENNKDQEICILLPVKTSSLWGPCHSLLQGGLFYSHMAFRKPVLPAGRQAGQIITCTTEQIFWPGLGVQAWPKYPLHWP